MRIFVIGFSIFIASAVGLNGADESDKGVFTNGRESVFTNKPLPNFNSRDYLFVLELNYQMQLVPYSHIRPNIQYIMNPNGFSEIDDALVLGTEFGITF